MKAIHQIKTWFKKLQTTFAFEPMGLGHLLGRPKHRSMAVEFAPVTQFNPPLNFRRPALDSLTSESLARIELRPRAKRGGRPSRQAVTGISDTMPAV
jgi:hypothetical protein